MLKELEFKAALRKLADEFNGNSSYSENRARILYHGMNHLNMQQLNDVFSKVLTTMPMNYLPTPDKILEIVHIKYPRGVKTIESDTICRYCTNTGLVDAFSKDDETWAVNFRCSCKFGQTMSGSMLTWKGKYKSKYALRKEREPNWEIRPESPMLDVFESQGN
jgi:hypothetical protein